MDYCITCFTETILKCKLCDNNCCSDHVYLNDRCAVCYQGKCHKCGQGEYLVCEKCDSVLCPSCVSITVCQTCWCICPDCYYYTCSKCCNNLSRKYQYLVHTPK